MTTTITTTRETQLINIIGAPRTGKTTIAKDLVKNEISNNGRALVVTPDDTDWLDLPRINIAQDGRIENFRGAVRHVFQDSKDWIYLNKFKNGLLVLDDCRMYLEAKMSPDVKRIFGRRRHYQRDIITITHGFTEVPPKVFTFSTHIILFKASDNIIGRRSVINDFDKVQEMTKRVELKSKTDPHYFEIFKY